MLANLEKLSGEVLAIAQQRLAPIQRAIPAVTEEEIKGPNKICSPLFGGYMEVIDRIEKNVFSIKNNICKIEL